MPSSLANTAAAASGGKRWKGRPGGARARKKQKRLDAIVDRAPAASTSFTIPDDDDDDPGLLRRSSRVRRVPVILDSSPFPSDRKKNPNPDEPPIQPVAGAVSKRKEKERSIGGPEKGKPYRFQQKETPSTPSTQEPKDSEADTGDWRSRLRSRVVKGRGNASFLGKGKEPLKPVMSLGEEKGGSDLQASGSRRRKKRPLSDDESLDVKKIGDLATILPSGDEAENREEASPEEESKLDCDPQGVSEPDKELEIAELIREAPEAAECMHTGGQDGPDQHDKACPENHAPTHLGEHLDSMAMESEGTLKENNAKPPHLNDIPAMAHVKEGRRCGLCGRGTDGRPPKRLAQESIDSDKEAYEGSSASEEPNYDVWDGFGDEPGWLGRLLGPIHDRFGIARVWVHLHCAVWSPEVYFAGLGCLKSVRAALCRGRALKCNRCGRPGATVGCRVDRCPKTYHLPCSRADGCIFDHRKFLIACNDHRHLFQPQGNDYSNQIKKMKAKKLKLDMKKLSNDAWRKDLEDEEKWLENCGEDEEFLKREGRRLHRDILRIAPLYIGGSSGSEKLYQGWDSVAGLQDVIQCIKEVAILPLLYPEFFSTLGLTPPRGILLHGYPGTGKTLVVRSLIGACSRGDKRIAYFARKGADCLGKYVGDAERQLRLLFQVAERCQPSIIFFDEIDGLAPCRSRHQDQTHCSVVSTLLSLLDGLKSRGSVVVIGATNRPEAVDPALRRPGRFDREIYFPLPSEKDRSDILSLHTRSWPNPASGSLLLWIAKQTVGYAGADLQSLCTQAAMNALKRNCSLQELLSSAEKGSDHCRLPSLPSLVVEERDWLAALAFASPPCSRRDEGMAANDVVSYPLHTHLIPCLLQPLSHLLISFYIDERIWLPPSLFKASISIKSAIISALEQKRVPTVSWWSHLHYLIQEPYFANEIERCLSRYGLVIGSSGCNQSYVLDSENNDPEKFDSCRLKPSTAHMNSRSKQNKWGKSLGFRALISGTPRSGQHHLASCLLNGFKGHIEIQKVNLATITQEGHGDIVRGLAQILLKCLNVGPCIIYMPRIDLWAIDITLGQEVEESTMTPKTPISSPITVVHDARSASEAWNSFVEQVDSACTCSSIIILATCEVQNSGLPLGIRQFFTSDILDHTSSAPSEHSIPRFFVPIDGNFNHDLVFNSSAAKLSQDLVQHYVQLMHQKTHLSNSLDKNKASHSVEVVSEAQGSNMENRHTSAILDTTVDYGRIASNSEAFCRDNQNQQVINSDQRGSLMSQIRSLEHVDVQLHNRQDSFPRALPSKAIKGNSLSAITTFGYQILRYPQFAELCWVTSKLKEGPCTDSNGPWKCWPFNSCVMHPRSSPEKVVGVNSSHLKDKERSGIVRGLIAVGLLAYRGVYTSVREVSFDVRKVLELLVGQIRAKILGKKDNYRYLPLLSQAAYLEDMVNSWAYTFQSSQLDNQTTAISTKSTVVGRLYADNNLSGSKLVDNQFCMPTPDISHNEVQEVSHKGNQKFVASNGECFIFTKRNADLALVNSDANMVTEATCFPELFPLAPSLRPSSVLDDIRLVSGDGPFKSDCTTPSKFNGLDVTESSRPAEANVCNLDSSVTMTKSNRGEVSGRCNGLEPVPSSNDSGSISDELGSASNLALGKNSHLSAVSEISCLYDCCSECLNAVYLLAQNILSDCWNLNSSCSTIDDIHDIVVSCSSNLLAAIRKCYTSQSNINSEEFFRRRQQHDTTSEHCVCQEVGDKHHKETSSRHKTSESITFLPTECTCHSKNKEETATISSERNSLLQPALKFFFRDGVLLPYNPQKDTVFHCRFEKLCICSILEMILMIRQPLN